MLPYSRGLILDNTHNYGIMKTEAVFGFGTPDQNNYSESFNASQPMEWIITNGSFQQRSLQEDDEPASTKPTFTVNIHTNSNKKSASNSQESKRSEKQKKRNKKKRQSKKINKCVIKFSKGDDQGNTRGKKRRRGNRIQKVQKKYMMPVILGLLAAKSILIPIALKALAFMSAKGLMMGFFSTVMASVLSLKGMFSHPQEYHNRKDDSKTQVEIIQIPTKSEDHIYYDDHQYNKRGDFVPLYPNMLVNGDHVVKKKATWNKG